MQLLIQARCSGGGRGGGSVGIFCALQKNAPMGIILGPNKYAMGTFTARHKGNGKALLEPQ